MSVPAVKFICSTLLAIVGLVVVKKISGSEEKLLSLKNILFMIFLVVLPAIIYDAKYVYIYTITIYVMTIICYKFILDISFIKSTISCGILFVFVIILDFIESSILLLFISVDTLRGTWYMNIITNCVFSIILITIFNQKTIQKWFLNFANKIESQKQTRVIIFFLLMIIAMSTIIYMIGIDFELNSSFMTNFLVFIALFFLVLILFSERNSYDKLSDDYDKLFDCVKVFEDWIEKEQFIRHEYKNQLAVLYAVTNEKSVREKIDNITDEMINVDGNVIQLLSNLPNGGLKGLLYYKIAFAKNKDVNIEVDISNKVGKVFKRLDDNRIKDLSKLIGVYCDNAIEAALNTNKKIVSIEIYNFDKEINIVISNTFNTKKDISKRNEKGVSTNGEGRGNGLYFANKLLSKSNWIRQNQKIIDNIYIQSLKIDIC